jgi:hypothetical protein
VIAINEIMGQVLFKVALSRSGEVEGEDREAGAAGALREAPR